MNNPQDIEINIDDQRAWLLEYKGVSGLSWNQLAVQIGIKAGTLSQFGGAGYNGNNQLLAEKVFRYRQTLAMQQQLRTEAPDIPGYFETRSSREFMALLAWAQRGRLTFIAGGPGTGKTSTAEEYKARAANVWLVTCMPSMKSVGALAAATLRAMGEYMVRGQTQVLSSAVITRVRNSGGLIIYDDAQHLSVEQIEEIRGWYDQTRVGVALFGNEQVVARMEGGERRAAFAQLYSRVGMRIIRPLPLQEDAEALAIAWRVEDEQIVQYIKEIARKPGGLRSCTFAMEIASTIAHSENSEVTLRHLTAAWLQLNSRPVMS